MSEMIKDSQVKKFSYGNAAAEHAQAAEDLLKVEMPKQVALAEVHASLAVYYQLKVR